MTEWCQRRDGLFKLSVEIQHILNRLVEHGANIPDIFSMLVYGQLFKLYMIQLQLLRGSIGCTKSLYNDED
ncbi:unnamed protein product [Rhizopus microsporus]